MAATLDDDTILASGHPDLRDDTLRVEGRPPLLGIAASFVRTTAVTPGPMRKDPNSHRPCSGPPMAERPGRSSHDRTPEHQRSPIAGDRSCGTSHRGVRVVPLLGACLACCIPMLLILGEVSVGAALAGAAGLAMFVALVFGATVIAPRLRPL